MGLSLVRAALKKSALGGILESATQEQLISAIENQVQHALAPCRSGWQQLLNEEFIHSECMIIFHGWLPGWGSITLGHQTVHTCSCHAHQAQGSNYLGP